MNTQERGRSEAVNPRIDNTMTKRKIQIMVYKISSREQVTFRSDDDVVRLVRFLLC